MKKKTAFADYNVALAGARPRPRLVETLDRFFPNTDGHALDLGCGDGRDTVELLSRGWKVDALLAEFKVEILREVEEDRSSFSEPLKHWHIFTIVARRRR